MVQQKKGSILGLCPQKKIKYKEAYWVYVHRKRSNTRKLSLVLKRIHILSHFKSQNYNRSFLNYTRTGPLVKGLF